MKRNLRQSLPDRRIISRLGISSANVDARSWNTRINLRVRRFAWMLS